jgi:hypothetical protein
VKGNTKFGYDQRYPASAIPVTMHESYFEKNQASKPHLVDDASLEPDLNRPEISPV